MKRSLVREYAFMFLYQLEIQNVNIQMQKEYFLAEYSIPDKQIEFFEKRIKGVYQNKDVLDKILEPYLVKWTLARLPRIDLSILRLALYEIQNEPDIPNNVAISEAVRLAKKYSGEESRSYINAILGNINRNLEKET
ncbi:MAG TPA: transcription antitermination factor NusB [Candidatus Eisenbacteria bacterium]|nr:transcription antitermination factor NusB [Candidatus Eisenbacteria bacterium]